MRKIQFQTEIDNKRAQKELDSLNRKIAQTEEKLNTAQSQKSGIEEQLKAAQAAAEATKAEIADLQQYYRETNDYMQGRTGNISPEDYNAAKQALAETSYQIKQQEALLKRQQGAVDRLTGKYQAADGKVKQVTASLERQQAAAGKVERQMARTADPGRYKDLAKTISTSLKGGLKTLLKYGLGIRSLYVLINKMRQILTEGLKQLAKYDKDTNAALSRIRNSWNGLKASLTSAFAPILQAVAPVLEKIIKWIAKAIDYVGMFIAVLRGQSTYKKAIAAQSDYAASLNDTAAAAKEANKYLSGLDEIRTYDDGKDKSSSVDASDFITGVEEVDISNSPIAKIIQDIKKFVVDKFGEIRKKVQPIIDKIGEGWKNVKAAVDKLVKSEGFQAVLQVFKNLLDIWLQITAANILTDIEVFLNMLTDVVNIIDRICDADLLGLINELKNLLVDMVSGPLLHVANLIDGIFGTDVAGWLRGIIQTVKEFDIGEWLSGIGQAISDKWHEFVAWIEGVPSSVKQKLDSIGNTIGTWWKENVSPWFTIERWKKLGADAVAALEANLGIHIDSVKEWWDEHVAPWFTLEKWRKTGSDAITNLKSGISTFLRYSPIAQWWSEKVAPWFTWEKWVQLGSDAIQAIKDGLSSLTLPRFHLEWGYASRHFSTIFGDFDISIPWPDLSFYAKGGIVDMATMFAPGAVAGEDGAEAIIPLERHTEWIKLVAEGLADIIIDRLTDAFLRLPMPAVATGQLIPPNLTVRVDGIDDLRSEIRSLSDAIKAQRGRGGSYTFVAQLDRRTIFEETIDEAALEMQRTGDNPFFI